MAPPDSLSLHNKVAIITGSGKENGIGAGIALSLARAGARVAINYISEATAPRAAQVVSTIQAVAGKSSVLVVRADVGTPEGAQKLIQETLEGFETDTIDILGKISSWAQKCGLPLINPPSKQRSLRQARSCTEHSPARRRKVF
jgi:NAD(P)-dependent dehydrogenase (short-subunit alcohol dehydrogenase family)